MIKDDISRIFVSYRNYTHYKKLGYDAILNEYLNIKTTHLPTTSHVSITCICEICSEEKTLQYNKYIKNKNRQGYYGCKSCSRQKAALTSLEKYGVDNYSKTEEWKIRFEKTNMEKIGYKTNLLDPICKEKIKKSLLDKYGTENHWEIRKPRKKFKLDQRVKEMGGESDIIPSEDLYMDHSMEDYLSYRRECRRLTKKNSKVLYGLWDGSDYYDGELIRNNLYLDHNSPNYPTVDHKKSIYWGFINNVSPLLISEISNLCITKRSINSRKRDLIMDQSSN